MLKKDAFRAGIFRFIHMAQDRVVQKIKGCGNPDVFLIVQNFETYFKVMQNALKGGQNSKSTISDSLPVSRIRNYFR
jgi:hypothetical protein